MRIGKYRYRVTVQQRASTQDALGEVTGAWSDVATLWGEVVPMTMREVMAAGQQSSIATTIMRIRYRADILPSMRVLWESKPYEIQSVVDVDGRHRVLELVCDQGSEDGR